MKNPVFIAGFFYVVTRCSRLFFAMLVFFCCDAMLASLVLQTNNKPSPRCCPAARP